MIPLRGSSPTLVVACVFVVFHTDTWHTAIGDEVDVSLKLVIQVYLSVLKDNGNVIIKFP